MNIYMQDTHNEKIGEFKSLLVYFINHITTLEDAYKFLKDNRDIKYNEYNNTTSKKILSCGLIYKFKDKLGVEEDFYKITRELILMILRGEENINNNICIRKYLIAFNDWKERDKHKYIYELACSYYNLEEMKKNIDDENDWVYNIDKLQIKIKNQIRALKETELFSKQLKDINKIKENNIKTIVNNIYWDDFEQQLNNNNYDVLYSNYLEIKNILLEIKNDIIIDDILDEKFLKKLIETNNMDKSVLLGQVEFIYDKILLYGIPIYDTVIKNLKKKLVEEIKENEMNGKLIRKVMEETMMVLENLINTVRLYRSYYKK